jgi:hypothetical protein
MSLPYHKVDWDLVREVRVIQARLAEQEKQIRDLNRLVSTLAAKVDDE